MQNQNDNQLTIGWASNDITPSLPIRLSGQFYARVAEGVRDPLTVTALALASGTAEPGRTVVMVSCDLISIPESLRDAVRGRVRTLTPELDPTCVILNATHTHTGPEVRSEADQKRLGGGMSDKGMGFDLPGSDMQAYFDFLVEQIAQTVDAAWREREPGSLGYGLGQAITSHNRRMAYLDGSSRMYGETAIADFSHVEGYEDHSVNVIATWDKGGNLSGLVVNLPCPAQVNEHLFTVSADYWHDTRVALRERFGEAIHILPQCSPAGDLSPHPLWNRTPVERMLYLSGRTQRQEIARRVCDTIADILPHIARERYDSIDLQHRMEVVELSRRKLSQQDVDDALAEAAESREKYKRQLEDIAAHPEKKDDPRWYVPLTEAYRRMNWCLAVKTRWESEQTSSTLPFELHVIRLGDVALGFNPFEYYLDFGIRIKARSPASQTFLIQLAGGGTYVPTRRAISGGGYGAIPASTPIGAEGGEEVVAWTVEKFKTLWQ